MAATDTTKYLNKTEYGVALSRIKGYIKSREDGVVDSQDSEFLYRQSPNVDMGNVLADSVKGRTLVWNQLVQDGNFAIGASVWRSDVSGSASFSNNIAHVNASSTSGSSFQPNLYQFSTYRPTIVVGHKYIFAFEAKAGENSTIERLNYRAGISFSALTLSTSWTKVALLYTATNASLSLLFWQYTSASSTVYTADFYIRNVRLFDLTLMFGAGNEPSNVEEFESLFPLPYYDYNLGELISFNADGIETVGFNQWDEEWGRGDIDGAGNMPGQNIIGVYLRSKNYIPAFPNTMYCISSVNEQGDSARRWVVYEYDAAKNFLGYTSLNSLVATFTTKAKTRFFRFRNNKDTTTYYNDICINISDPAKNGQYEQYKTSTLSLNVPSMTSGGVQIFPDGMRSAGSVYDEAIVEPDGYIRKVVKRVGDVDLGTLTWAYRSSDGYFYAVLADRKQYGQGLCIEYNKIYTTSVNPKNIDDKSYVFNTYAVNNGINIKDTAYTDATTFKSAMSGVMLYYELASPVEYTLDVPIYVGSKFYLGGTQTVLPENTTAPTTTPFRGKFKYFAGFEDVQGMILAETSKYLPLKGGTMTGALRTVNDIYIDGYDSNGTAGYGSIIKKVSVSGGWARSFLAYKNSNNDNLFTLSAYGTADTLEYAYLGSNSYSSDGNLRIYSNGLIRAAAIAKAGGTSSQFLKADGSVDTNTYLTTSSASNTYVPKTTTVNGHALSSNVVVTKADVGLDNVENIAISTWAGSGLITRVGTIASGEWNGTPIGNEYLENPGLTVGSAYINLGSSATLAQLGIPSWALDYATLTGRLDSVYHPLGGGANVNFTAHTLSVNNTASFVNSITVGSGHVSGATGEEQYRKIEFGSSGHFIELKNVGTTASPEWAFHFSDGIYSDSFVSAGGRSDTTEGGGDGGGSGTGVNIILLPESERETITIQNGYLYMFY